MQTISLNLRDCFGIRDMHQFLNFNGKKVITIYARNGLMKTSFAKTIKKIQTGKEEEICDAIFEDDGEADVKIDGRTVSREDFFVINSFESAYESDITSLLVRGPIRDLLSETLRLRDRFLRFLSEKSGLKIKKISGGTTIYELENAIIEDFEFEEKSILLNLQNIADYGIDFNCSNISYATIFDPAVIKKIKTPEFQEQIASFVEEIDQIYNSFSYMRKGELTLPSLRNIKKTMEKDHFFVQENKIIFTGVESIDSLEVLQERIDEVETAVRNIPSLSEISKILSDVKGSSLLREIELHPEIVEYLAIDRLGEFKKILWKSYIESAETIFNNLLQRYLNLSEALDNIPIDDTPWKNALTIFESRFSVPYKMEIANLKGSIIGESVPHVLFSFSKGQRTKKISRVQLEEADTLSQGEKRALYLLNIIFDIEQLKEQNSDKVLVIDDIADSFDYKNKYAIIEYLYELAQNQNFYLIILSHNFDFYRAVSLRLSVARSNRLFADTNNGSVVFTQEHYQNNPFEHWKTHLNQKNILAMIPFVRNLIQFGKDDGISVATNDYLFLTSLLHEKNDTDGITYNQLLQIYNHYLGITEFQRDVDLTHTVIDSLIRVCDSIGNTDELLENKVILAMGIRHMAERFMISKIQSYAGILRWNVNHVDQNGNAEQFLAALGQLTNQTRTLYNAFIQASADSTEIEVMNEVNIMTPENIHLNSFMYEPILDMDIESLRGLYIRVKALNA